MNTDIWDKQLDDFLIERKWIRRLCAGCGRTFYAKKRNEAKLCLRGQCSPNQGGFLNLSRRRIPLTIQSVAKCIESAFVACGYKKLLAVNITETFGNTDLIGAGVQILEPTLFGVKPVLMGASLVFQPVARMQYFGDCKENDRGSTSFVNVCSEEASCSFGRHLEHIDTWLGILSHLGLFMGNVILLRRISSENWGNGEFRQFELFVTYGDLELGDAVFGLVPTRTWGILPISDIGFGLERLVWAINKFSSYFDPIRPLSFGLSFSRHTHDVLRTAALLTLCGIEASNESTGFQLRKVCKSAFEDLGGSSGEGDKVFLHYVNFWASFLAENRTADEALGRFRKEMSRLAQTRLRETLKGPEVTSETIEAYATHLVYNLGVPIDEVKKALGAKYGKKG